MRSRHALATSFAVALLITAALPSPARAQTPVFEPERTSEQDPGLGLDLFASGGLGWPAAADSLEALDLGSKTLDFGGGARVTGLWRRVFTQAALTRWSDQGERAFIASDGTSFKLGIPLDVNATFVDGTVGLKDVVRTGGGRISFLSYFGAGVGVVRYNESSPFAEPGDDVSITKPSYHVLLGVEVPVVSWLAIAVDGRYRYIPGLLGDDGASGLLDEDTLGGFQMALGLRIGFGGPVYQLPTQAPAPGPAPTPVERFVAKPAVPETSLTRGTMIEAAPVFLLPDPTRTPLRTLPAGTTVRILEQNGDWIRLEFEDPQWGSRVGYVQRRFVQVR